MKKVITLFAVLALTSVAFADDHGMPNENANAHATEAHAAHGKKMAKKMEGKKKMMKKGMMKKGHDHSHGADAAADTGTTH